MTELIEIKTNHSTECDHDWVVIDVGDAIFVKCAKCRLSVEVYPNHISVWHYGEDAPWLALIKFVPNGQPTLDESEGK